MPSSTATWPSAPNGTNGHKSITTADIRPDSRPAGTPYWQQRACPPWCTGPHEDTDPVGAGRSCWGDTHEITLSTEDPDVERGPAGGLVAWPRTARLWLRRDDRETAPRIGLAGSDADEMYLTLAEAEELAERLAALIVQGRT